jgi:hypothetical protein
MDKYALKECVKAVDGELGVDPRTARLYDELADFAAKDAPATVPGDAFRGGYMMRYGAHLLPFEHGQILNLETGAREAIVPGQRVWRCKTLQWHIPGQPEYPELLRWSEHYLLDEARQWMPATYAMNTDGVALRERFMQPSSAETELQCVARDVVSLLMCILGPLLDTVFDRICPALFERAHRRCEFIVLSGTGTEGKSLLFALLRLVAPALVVKAEALAVGGRGLCGNNESWFKAKDAAIVVTEEVDGILDGNGVSISCSKKYGHEIETKFCGLIVLLTNSRLNFRPLDGALVGRMLSRACRPSSCALVRRPMRRMVRRRTSRCTPPSRTSSTCRGSSRRTLATGLHWSPASTRTTGGARGSTRRSTPATTPSPSMWPSASRARRRGCSTRSGKLTRRRSTSPGAPRTCSRR